MSESRSGRILLLVHVGGECSPRCPMCPWFDVLEPGVSLSVEKVREFVERLSTLGIKIKETHILCPNPTRARSFESVHRILFDASRRVTVWMHVGDLDSFKPGLLYEGERILLVTTSYEQLYSYRNRILGLESWGFEDIEVLFAVIPGVNEADVLGVLEFCRLRGLKPVISEPLFSREQYSLDSIVHRRLRDVEVSLGTTRFIGAYFKEKAFYRGYPFSIVRRGNPPAYCDVLYLHNTGRVMRCPLSETPLATTPSTLSPESLASPCPLEPNADRYHPIIKVSLVGPRGEVIESEILELLDLLDKYGSIRKAASALGISHTAVRKRISAFESKLRVRLIDKAFNGKTIRLTYRAREILEAYRRALRLIQGDGRGQRDHERAP